MNKKIFRSGFFTSLLVLLITMLLIIGVLFEYFEGLIFDELESEAGYISYALEREGVGCLEDFENIGKRITLIAPDGTVLNDTSADVSKLDNHKNRREVVEALENGSGMSARYSDTLMEKTLYYATVLKDGNILRVATTSKSIIVILLGLMHPLVIIIILALIISFVVSGRVSNSIVKPLNELDLENPANNETYEELTPLLRKISAQNKTIKKQIKDAERKREEFKLITENMSEGLLVIDNKEQVLTYNNAALCLLDITDIKSDSALTFNRTRGFRHVMEKALRGERAEREISIDEKTYNLIANPVFSGEKIIGAVIIIIDVTEAVKREQLRREFTSNVSHELKTPLTSISGFAEIMKSGDVERETIADFSASIYDEAQRLITLVSDIIKISEIDEDSVQFVKENVDVYKLSRNIIKHLMPYAEKKNITLNLTGDNAEVFGTEKIIDEMIYNLCDNAIKYNKENGSVDVIISKDNNKTSVTVRDTGIGIPMSEQQRVFERFYRVDKSHSKLVGGTGLGLAIVKHGAIYHNAEINLESVEGKGTSVTIVFNNM